MDLVLRCPDGLAVLSPLLLPVVGMAVDRADLPMVPDEGRKSAAVGMEMDGGLGPLWRLGTRNSPPSGKSDGGVGGDCL